MKTKVAIIFGGKSAEHEVSLNSATNIYNAIDKTKYDVLLLGNDKNGVWHFNSNYNKDEVDLTNKDYFLNSQYVSIDRIENKISIIDKSTHEILENFDIAFPIIHGTYGEDGALQGFLKFLNIPFVGPDILGSAICMDKDVTKRLLRDNNIPIANFISLYKSQQKEISFGQARKKLGIPMFIKPCNAGSSVGVNKVIDESSFKTALHQAFEYDNKILIEEAIMGKEVECAVLGNENPKASVIGEIIPTKDFYSYGAKYKDADGAKMKIPAEIPDDVSDTLQKTALKAFNVTCCEGMARVDFFLKDDNTLVINEINTLPGFTEISMYPKLWEQTGISYSDLISKLIELSIERHKRNNELNTAHNS